MPEGPPVVSSFQASSSVFAGTERHRFYVDLKESSNVVSWKKLLKSVPALPGVEAPPGANPALEARLAPEPGLLTKEPRGASNRFSNVIEKIERLYQGQPQDSDDDVVDDQLDNVPDDDQYNTDDSFIDDEELDEYFCVDRAKTLHNGFFINKGKLENIEPSPPPMPPPKKRKRRDASSDPSDPLKRSRKPDPPCKENLQGASLDGEPFMKVGECLVNKQVDTQTQHAATLSKGSSKGAPRSKGDPSVRNGAGKSAASSSPNKAKLYGDYKLSLATPASATENPPKRATAPKVTLLERAIQDLQAGVAHFCPSAPDVQEAEQASGAPGKTRRLPREIKQKIAKVARLAAKQGKIPDELINRLMGILGHLMQLKTLKRNLKEMVESGIAAKQEKDGRIYHMKREFTEMVHLRVSSQAKEGVSEDFQGIPGSSDRKLQYKWDNATEDRICDLYDQYLEGTDENRGVQSRKLYMELAELWPEGWMDKEGIKTAIYRSKERKKAIQKQSLNESRKKIAERIDLNDRLPEVPTSSVNLSLSNRDLPSSALQTGKPAVIRQRGLLLDKLNDSKDKKRPETETGELAFLKFRKQRGGIDEDASYQAAAKSGFLQRPNDSVTLDGPN